MKKKYTCIAVDDNKDALKCIEREMCKSKLFTLVKTFTDFHQAVVYLKEHSINLLLCDVELSDGLISYTRLKDIPAQIPVIFITMHRALFADVSFETKENQNVIDCLCKPMTKDDVQKIEDLYTSYLKRGHNRMLRLFRNKEMYLCCELMIKKILTPRKIQASSIVMIKPYDEIHGCMGYAIGHSSPFMIKQKSLKSIFSQLDEDCPKTFILVGRKGIINSQMVTFSGNHFIPEQDIYQNKDLFIEIPARIQVEIEELYTFYRKITSLDSL